MNEVKDRLVQYPRRFRMVDLGDGIIELTPEPGTVQEEGTPIDKALFDSIKTDFTEVNKDISNLDSTKANLTQVVRTDISQNLEEAKKLKAQENIGVDVSSPMDTQRVYSKWTISVSTTTGYIKICSVYIYDTNFYLEVKGGLAEYQIDTTIMIGSTNGSIQTVMCYGILPKDDNFYYVKTDTTIDIYYKPRVYGKIFITLKMTGGVLLEKGNDTKLSSLPSGNELISFSNTVLPSNPTFTSGTSGRLSLPDKGWYYFKIGTFKHVGIIYWDGSSVTRSPGFFAASSGSYVSTIDSIKINEIGIIYIVENGKDQTSGSVSYIKIAS